MEKYIAHTRDEMMADLISENNRLREDLKFAMLIVRMFNDWLDRPEVKAVMAEEKGMNQYTNHPIRKMPIKTDISPTEPEMVWVQREDLEPILNIYNSKHSALKWWEAYHRLKAALTTGEKPMWPHSCPVEGQIAVGKGEECNWCGVVEKK